MGDHGPATRIRADSTGGGRLDLLLVAFGEDMMPALRVYPEDEEGLNIIGFNADGDLPDWQSVLFVGRHFTPSIWPQPDPEGMEGLEPAEGCGVFGGMESGAGF